MKKVVYLLILTAICTACIGGCRRAGIWLAKSDLPAHADAMILLMGSFPERVLEAADLYHEGKADRLIIVSESMGPYRLLESRGADIVSTTVQARNAAVSLGVPADSIIILPGDARSTLDEALAVRDYLKMNPSVDTIALVSSPAHMRRASMIFATAMRKASLPVYIGSGPSRYSGFNAEKWWRSREDIQSVLSELVKTGGFVIFERKKLNTPDGKKLN